MFLRDYAGNPLKWGSWYQFNYTGDIFYTQQQTVTVAANSDHAMGVTAPALGSFTFLYWLQPASIGSINWAYMERVTSSTSNLWTSNQSTARNFVCTALYRHKN